MTTKPPRLSLERRPAIEAGALDEERLVAFPQLETLPHAPTIEPEGRRGASEARDFPADERRPLRKLDPGRERDVGAVEQNRLLRKPFERSPFVDDEALR